MADQELLELAAKAFGASKYICRDNELYIDGNVLYWNPLTDDGDALRLAVKLRMIVSLADCCCCAVVDWDGNDDDKKVYVRFSENFHDREALNGNDATRIAIVRAAAEIGKAMK